MDKIIVNPLDVRGLGNIVSPKTISDFGVLNSTISSSTDTVNNESMTVYTTGYRQGEHLTLSFTGFHIFTETLYSFPVIATLYDSYDDVMINKALTCTVDGTDTVWTGRTNSKGQVTFNIPVTDEGLYRFRVKYTTGDGGCTGYGQVIIGNIDSLVLNSQNMIIVNNGTNKLFAMVTGNVDGEPVSIHGLPISFYEEYLLYDLRFKSSLGHYIEDDDVTTFSVTVIDEDGSRVPGMTVNFYEEYEAGTLAITNTETAIVDDEALTLSARLKNVNGGAVSGETVSFYEEYDADTIRLTGNKAIIKDDDTVTLTAGLYDVDGSIIRVPDTSVSFYEEYDLSSILIRSDVGHIIEDDDTVTFTVTLKDKDGSRLPGQTVELYGEGDCLPEGDTLSLSAVSSSILVGDAPSLTGVLSVGSGESVKIYKGDSLVDTVTTGTNGAFSFTDSATTASGSLSYHALYGDDLESSTVTITVSKHSASLSGVASPTSLYVGSNVTFSGTVKIDNTGTSGLSIKIYNGETLVDTVTSGTDGAYTKTISGLAVGTHALKAVYEGSSANSNATSSTYNVTVSKVPTGLSINVPQLVYSDAFNITGVLKDTNNTAIGSASVKLYMETGGSTTLEATGTTNSNGEVTFARSAPTSITNYKFWLVYEGNSTYSNVTSSEETRTVGKETSVLTVTTPSNNASVGSTMSIAGTLLSNDGEAMASKSVLVKENGTTLTTLTTDSNGAFSGSVSNLSSGSHTLSFEFATDTYYTACTVSRSVTVASVTPSTIAVTSNKSALSYYHSDSATITATVTGSDSNPMSGQTVSIKVYDSTGTTLKETLTVTDVGDGTYTASYSSKGAGDLYIKAECMNLQETYAIEDCVLANGSASITGTSTSDTTYTLGFDDLGYDLSSSDFTLEADMTCSQKGSQLNIGAKTEWSISPVKGNYRAWIGCNSSGAGTYGTRTTSSNGSTGGSFTLSTAQAVKIVKSGTSFDFYLNGTKLGTKSGATWWANYSDWSLYLVQWTTGTTSLSNIKLKIS